MYVTQNKLDYTIGQRDEKGATSIRSLIRADVQQLKSRIYCSFGNQNFLFTITKPPSDIQSFQYIFGICHHASFMRLALLILLSPEYTFDQSN